eukprot:827295-Prorocentrum_minimum.AAC.2
MPPAPGKPGVPRRCFSRRAGRNVFIPRVLNTCYPTVSVAHVTCQSRRRSLAFCCALLRVSTLQVAPPTCARAPRAPRPTPPSDWPAPPAPPPAQPARVPGAPPAPATAPAAQWYSGTVVQS